MFCESKYTNLESPFLDHNTQFNQTTHEPLSLKWVKLGEIPIDLGPTFGLNLAIFLWNTNLSTREILPKSHGS